MTDSERRGDKNVNLAATTVGGTHAPSAIDAAVRSALNEESNHYEILTTSAPGKRGTEVRLVSDHVDKHVLKEALRQMRASLEAGEQPTGAWHA